MSAAIKKLLRPKILCPTDATAYEMVEILLAAWEECHRELAALSSGDATRPTGDRA